MSDLRVADVVLDCMQIEEPDTLAKRVLQETRKCGLEYISAAGGALRYPRPEQVLYAGFPEEWTQRYLEDALYLHDPVLKRCVVSEMPFEWNDALRGASAQEAEVMHLASEMGLKNGYVIPLQGPDSYTGYVSLCGERVGLSPQTRLDLHVIGFYFHQRLRELHESRQSAPSYWGQDLSGREKECLKWFAAGKSNWEVGEILNISENTVKRHIDRIKQKFEVSTRVQVVVEGIRRGIIEL